MIVCQYPKSLLRAEGVTDFKIAALEDFQDDGRRIRSLDEFEITTRHHRGGRATEENNL